jgi:hypothetical protein
MSKQPNQPIVRDTDGRIRFQENAIVRYLLDEATAGNKVDLNHIWRQYARTLFTIEDMEQFYQLIGYSVSAFAEISAFRRESVRATDRRAAALVKKEGK